MPPPILSNACTFCGKLRVPYSGGRYYVMTQDVATAAGLDIHVEPGQVHLDPKTGTAWVNSDDWLRLPDSPDQGIKHILGGADQDDALWVHGFTDHDGAGLVSRDTLLRMKLSPHMTESAQERQRSGCVRKSFMNLLYYKLTSITNFPALSRWINQDGSSF